MISSLLLLNLGVLFNFIAFEEKEIDKRTLKKRTKKSEKNFKKWKKGQQKHKKINAEKNQQTSE